MSVIAVFPFIMDAFQFGRDDVHGGTFVDLGFMNISDAKSCACREFEGLSDITNRINA